MQSERNSVLIYMMSFRSEKGGIAILNEQTSPSKNDPCKFS